MDKEGKAIKLLKALSDATRLRIVEFLLEGEKCVCEIIPYAKRKQSTVSIQLGKLKNSDILESRRDGKKIYYKIKDYRIYDIFKALGYTKDRVMGRACRKRLEVHKK